MSAFEDDGYELEEQPRRCKPNYEEMITKQKSKNETTINLSNSLIEYLDVHGVPRRDKQFNLQQLVGTLQLESRYGNIAVEKLIKQQEENKS